MISKAAQYLQAHLDGEVTTAPDVLEYFSNDASIFKVKPQVAVYPRSTNDVRKVARFAWQLAEKGSSISITPRGSGADFSGGAIGDGIILVFPAHLNKLLELDRNNTITIQPGINFAKLEQTLHTHGRTIPLKLAASEYTTIGGLVAGNGSGDGSIKYGQALNFVKSLTVVLANGELVRTRRLSKRELKKKIESKTFEGEIYQKLNELITHNSKQIEKLKKSTKNVSGYNLADVKKRDGSFDLTPLIVGSQGTLGIISQVKMVSKAHNPKTSLMAIHYQTFEAAYKDAKKISALKPSILDFIDEKLLELVNNSNPQLLKEIVNSKTTNTVLIVEIDDTSTRTQKRKIKQLKKIINDSAVEYHITSDEQIKEQIWKIRDSVSSVLWQSNGKLKAVPVIDDAVVPFEKVPVLIKLARELFSRRGIQAAMWGHLGEGHIHVRPFFDLSNATDRQQMVKLADTYYAVVTQLGGSISGSYNDGRARAPYLEMQFGLDGLELFKQVKNIFDPLGFLNPGVKINVSKTQQLSQIRNDYSLKHFYDYLPRS